MTWETPPVHGSCAGSLIVHVIDRTAAGCTLTMTSTTLSSVEHSGWVNQWLRRLPRSVIAPCPAVGDRSPTCRGCIRCRIYTVRRGPNGEIVVRWTRPDPDGARPNGSFTAWDWSEATWFADKLRAGGWRWEGEVP